MAEIGAKYRAVIVDDEELARRLLRELLGRHPDIGHRLLIIRRRAAAQLATCTLQLATTHQ